MTVHICTCILSQRNGPTPLPISACFMIGCRQLASAVTQCGQRPPSCMYKDGYKNIRFNLKHDQTAGDYGGAVWLQRK